MTIRSLHMSVSLHMTVCAPIVCVIVMVVLMLVVVIMQVVVIVLLHIAMRAIGVKRRRLMTRRWYYVAHVVVCHYVCVAEIHVIRVERG